MPAPDETTQEAPPTYKAEQANDGTWTIYAVPIFAVHVDSRGGKPIAFNRKWLERALRKGKTRHEEGYSPPLHISHHGDGEVEAAGRVRFTEIKDHPHGGKPIATLFADLVGVRPEVYQRIRRGELPYRSVEILDIDQPEIDSLALLDDEVPYFRFPLLKIGVEKRQRPTPMLAYSAAGSRASALFAFEEQKMPHKPEDEEHKEEAPGEEAPAADAPEWALAMGKVLAAIAKSLGVELEEASAEEADDEAEAEAAALQAAPLEVGIADAMRAEAHQDAMAATVDALKNELAALKGTQRVERRAAALKELGFSADHISKFRAIAESKGETAAKYWADAMEETHATPPPAGFNGEMAPPHIGIDPEAVRRYGKMGPEALDKARAIARSYEAGIPQGKTARHDLTLAEYLEISMDSEGYFAASRAAAGKGK